MSALVHDRFQQYAVISVGRDHRSEILVIPYSDEKTLRGLLAAPSILSLGYCSRIEAMASLDMCFQTGHGQNLTTTSVVTAKGSLGHSGTTQWPFRYRSDAAEHLGVVRDLLHHSVVAAITYFYSNHLLSEALRAWLPS